MRNARILSGFWVAISFGLALFGNAQVSSARVLQWELHDVKFEDGDPISGFFTYDANANPGSRLLSWDIAITPFDFLPAYRFSSALEPNNFELNGDSIVLFSKALLDIDPLGRTAVRLQLDFPSALTDAGGAVTAAGFEDCTYICGTRSIVAGEMTAVPEPSGALAVALGVGVLAGFLRCAKDQGAVSLMQ